MSAAENGGPAFPTAPQQIWDGDRDMQIGERAGLSGMTLRDYFAASALMGPIADLDGTAEEHAQIAYEYADAMLRAREGKL